jgi:aspartyl-tRNA(Asn)/glutamyl-tRNA(Gln) amidotransferase subunit B
MSTPYGSFEAVIGLEVHAQLLTRTKAFCACETSFGDPANTHTCPVCLGLPGALPVLGEEAVRMAVSAALALGCTINPRSVFARKNYFYPDLPKGYQISQYEEPLATHGHLEIETDAGRKRARILRVHMEEDAGKNLHGLGDESVVDLNRAGTPLIEIVGEPDLRTGAEAAEYLKRLREVLMFVGVNDGNLEQGSFRCDANVSVRRRGEHALGTRAELKNINSFRFVAEAIDIEARRQIALIERGERVRMQTRGYNADRRETYVLRDKEGEAGYRYFPEPDLPPLVLDRAFVEDLRVALPPSPAQRRRRMVDELGLTPQAAAVLTGHPQISSFYDATVLLYAEPVKAANFIQSEVLRDVRVSGLSADIPVSPNQVAELLRLVDKGTISGKQAKDVYARMRATHARPEEIVRERGMSVISDEGALEAMAHKLVAENPKQAESYRAGKANILGFFVGQMMKLTGGSAEPAVVNKVLKRVLVPSSDASGERVASAPETLSPARPAPAREDERGSAPKPPGAADPSAPGSSRRDREDQSPMAHSVPPPPLGLLEHTTLTSASGAVLPPAPDSGLEDAFVRLDMRVGRVVSAERVARKESLLELGVDVGEAGPRRIFAGLGLSFAPEQLVGQRVVVCGNLSPRDLGKGIVSEGTILVAASTDGLALVTVAGDTLPGTRVR